MASVPSKPRQVFGRVDAEGRLIEADPELEALQRQAGAGLGQMLALPQIAEVAALARKLGTAVARPAIAAAADHDVELWVYAEPQGGDISLSLEGWTARPVAGPRLAAILGGGSDAVEPAADRVWVADEGLRILSLSPGLGELIGSNPAEAAGSSLNRLFRLEEDADGELPLLAALAARRPFTGQRARSRSNDCLVLLAGEPVEAPDGGFAGFRGTAQPEDATPAASGRPVDLDPSFDDLLRLPVGRILASAEHIGARADGPLGNEYASYGNDIAAAARHLMSVLKGMRENAAHQNGDVDLGALAAEAVVMLESSAEEQGIKIEFDIEEPLRVLGEERAIIQIIVNLISNAIRHSPRGGTIRLTFSRTDAAVSVCVIDQGSGIPAGDEQRIFERFERAENGQTGTGLGLAISRRLARAMGGDVTLDSVAGEGARFTLTLPAA